ncbi:hypothetical protein SJAV_03680 [Sulfurisphaera javensis]|uniref:SWIM-type domain-containing protein n=1 Tax=Sulfurisphaera javensis TaxID=2049879 RepID=A0AAT9GNE6_9CREN
MNIKILSVTKKDNLYEVEGLVPAKCAVGYYHVKIKLQGFRIIESKCDCGENFCTHAIKLEFAYVKMKNKLSS